VTAASLAAIMRTAVTLTRQRGFGCAAQALDSSAGEYRARCEAANKADDDRRCC
jgi:hypothetical protein